MSWRAPSSALVFGVDEMIDERYVSSGLKAELEPVSGWPFPVAEPWTLQRLSHAYAEWVLGQTGGDKQRAAEILGVDLSTLYRWRRKSDRDDQESDR